jgi:hypothetical protein
MADRVSSSPCLNSPAGGADGFKPRLDDWALSAVLSAPGSCVINNVPAWRRHTRTADADAEDAARMCARGLSRRVRTSQMLPNTKPAHKQVEMALDGCVTS